ncbi:MAG: beta strand repeat-containing protein, partial [Rhodoluna sp.]
VWIQADSQDSAAAATKFVTDNGDITFWTASAGGTDGSIVTGNYTFVDSTNGRQTAQATGGGRITFGGGSVSSNGVPTGPAIGGTNSSYGVYIYGYNRFYSGGGDIWMYGKSNSGTNHGLLANSDLIMDSGQGQITLRGDNVGAEWGLSLGNSNSGDMTIVSEKTTGTAIDISANSPAYAALIINRLASSYTVYIAATGGGAINLTGNGSTSYVGVGVDRAQILSSSGKITIDGGASYASLSYQSWGQVYLGAKAGSAYVTSSSADILVKGTTYVDTDNTTTQAANTTGNVVVESAGASFSSASNWGLATTAGSFRFGKSTDTQDATIAAAVTASVTGSSTGAATVYGKAVTISAAMSATSITVAPTAAYAGAGSLTATAGNISITGGTSVTPTANFRASGNITTSGSGQTLFNSITLNSTAGSISITAGPYAGHAVQINASTISATTQPISISGTGTSGEGVYAYGSSSISTTSGAINITGVGTDWGVYLGALDVVSTSGAIRVDGGTRGIVDGYGATTNFGALPAGSSSSDITVLGDRQWSGSTQVNYKTTGAVVLDSKAANYIEAPSYVNHKFDGCSSVSISHLSASWTVTMGVTATIAGPFSAQGQYMKFNASASIKTTLAKAAGAVANTGVLVKATDKIYALTGATFETSGADITFWSDSDNSGIGNIYFEGNETFKSAGGRITMAGGLDDGAALNAEITGRTSTDGLPDNYAPGDSFGANAGVDLLGTYQVLSAGGDIFIAGKGSAVAGDDDYGVVLRGGLMYSDTGKIAIYGKNPASCSANWHRAIAMAWNGDGGTADNIISNSTATDAIFMRGDSSSCVSGSYAFGIQAFYSSGANIATPNGGGITLYGNQNNASGQAGTWTNNNQESNILELNYTNVLSNSGPINLSGIRTAGTGNYSVRFNTRGTSQSNSIGASSAAISTGMSAYSSIAITSSTSDLTVTGDSIILDSTYVRNTGNLVMQPNAASFDRRNYFSSNWRSYFPATYKSVRIGKAGTDGSTQNNADIDLDRFASSGDIAVYGGNITLNNGLTTSETSGTGILVKATNTITYTGGSTGANVTTTVTGTNSTAPINIWANADASGEGYIYINNYNDFTTQGGAINFGGSAAASDTSPSSYAVTNTSSRGGVTIGNTNGTSNANVRITSNGGNIS